MRNPYPTLGKGFLAALGFVVGCSQGQESATSENSACLSSGVTEESYLEISGAQLRSIVELNILDVGPDGMRSVGCMGAVIAPRIVVTARHCFLDRPSGELTVMVHPLERDGLNATGAAGWSAVEVERHDSADLAVVRLAEDLTSQGVVPLEVGAQLELKTQDLVLLAGREAGLKFAVQEVTSSANTEDFWVNGNGEASPCAGDSGGPALTRSGPSGSVQVVGVLAGGSSDCAHTNRYVRLAAYREWLATFDDSSTAITSDCPLGLEKKCINDVLVHCEAGLLSGENCRAQGLECGWSALQGDYACLATADMTSRCGVVDSSGTCAGDVAEWCESGVLRFENCQRCSHRGDTGRADCAAICQ